jgi:hypothetical protein
VHRSLTLSATVTGPLTYAARSLDRVLAGRLLLAVDRLRLQVLRAVQDDSSQTSRTVLRLSHGTHTL